MPIRHRPIALLLPLFLGAVSLKAQTLEIAAGYARTGGRIGDPNSTHGPSFRVGLDLLRRRVVSLGLEAGLDFQDEARYTSTNNCLLPGGGTGTCTTDTRNRDLGRTAALVVRARIPSGRVSPYLLAGLGIISVREHERSVTTDATGAVLSNFSYDVHSTDGALQVPLGAGVEVGRFFLEGRATYVVYNYSGGIQSTISPRGYAGFRWRFGSSATP